MELPAHHTVEDILVALDDKIEFIEEKIKARNLYIEECYKPVYEKTWFGYYRLLPTYIEGNTCLGDMPMKRLQTELKKCKDARNAVGHFFNNTKIKLTVDEVNYLFGKSE
jgi:deoxyadenosine/deoxycytidine kinase